MDGYGSITIANHGLFRLIRFSRELALICQKKFINIFYLILLNGKISFEVTGAKKTGGSKSEAQGRRQAENRMLIFELFISYISEDGTVASRDGTRGRGCGFGENPSARKSADR